MKSNHILVAALACCAALIAQAQTEPGRAQLGAEKTVKQLRQVRIENYQGESLGRIKDLGIDLPNGRIIEVYVASGEFLGMGGKLTAVPPLALTTDLAGDVYYLDTTVEAFKAAPAVKLSDLPDSHRTAVAAASYRRFGQAPYFLEVDEPADPKAARPKQTLSIVQRSSKLLGLPVTNLTDLPLGTVVSVSYDVAAGVVNTVAVVSSDLYKIETVIPATALCFNAAHDKLLVDLSKQQFADQPRQVVTAAANGQDATYREEPYKGPVTSVPLVQGRSYRDIDRTALITRELRAAKIKNLSVTVGTLDGRVTLRGTARSEADKARAGAIAGDASKVERVDNQLVVVGN